MKKRDESFESPFKDFFSIMLAKDFMSNCKTKENTRED